MKFNFLSTKMFKDEIKNIYSIKKTKKNYSSQLELTFQTCDPGHENEITSWKKNQNHNL